MKNKRTICEVYGIGIVDELTIQRRFEKLGRCMWVHPFFPKKKIKKKPFNVGWRFFEDKSHQLHRKKIVTR